MDFKQAVKSGFNNYVNFEGRASRSAYWWWFLFYALLYIAAKTLGSLTGLTDIFTSAIALVLFLPSLSVGIRRLHDIDRSGWWYLIIFIPIIGFIILLFWAAQEGTPGPNRFGAAPIKSEAEKETL